MSDKEAAWDALHAALPAGWVYGQPSYHAERQEWLLYAYDPSERPLWASAGGSGRPSRRLR